MNVAAPNASSRAPLPVSYGLWLGGSLLSQVGDAALYFALGWAASAISGQAAGLVLSAVVLPRTVLLMVGGVVGDRVGPRRVMITSNAVMLTVTLVLAVVAAWWETSLPLLVLCGLVVGVVDAFYLPSSGSMPRRLVPDDQLSRALALRQTGVQLVAMIGGPVGGAVVAVAGLPAAAGVDAMSFLVVLVVLIAIRPRFEVPPETSGRSAVRDAVHGVRVAVATPGLGAALLLVAGVAGFVVPSTSLLIPLLARQQHWTVSIAGLVVGAQGVGAIVASLIVARRGSARRPGPAAACGLGVIALGQLCVGLLGSAPLAVATATLIGLGTGTFVANLAPVLLGTAPRTHLARIQALLGLVQSSALLVTNNALGGIARIWSATTAMLCCAVVVSACAGVAALTPSLRRIGSDQEGGVDTATKSTDRAAGDGRRIRTCGRGSV